MGKKFINGIFLIVFGLTGCSTLTINDVKAPLHRVQQSVAAASPFGIRRISSNKREFLSGYFLYSGGKYKEADALPQRMYAHWSILGDRRPYTVEVQVRLERRSGRGAYSEVGTSKELAKVLYKSFRKNLDERLEERNVIDDYNVF